MPTRPVMAPALRHARTIWEQELASARARGDEPVVAELMERKVTLLIRYEGSTPDFAAAGIDAGFDRDGFATAYVAMRDLDRVQDLHGATEVTIQSTLMPYLDTSVKEIRVPWKTPGIGGFEGRGAGVIVAVIDTGIDVYHQSFRKSDGKTRILELWDQSSGLTGGGPPPSPAMPGRIYSQAQIDAGLQAASFESVDDNGHGTHVAGIAAGSGRQDDRCSGPGTYVGVAPEADLVVVKAIAIKTRSDVVAALDWCAMAGSRHGGKPVVVNCSFGSSIGPHDGGDDDDVGFDKILRPVGGPPKGLVVVCAAGNEGASDIHESGTVPPGGMVIVPFYMPDNSFNPDVLEIWYDGASRLGVEVIAPASAVLPPPNTTTQLAPGTNTKKTIGGMTVEVDSSLTLPSHSNRARIRVTISVTPPTAPPSAGTTSPKVAMRDGTWQLVLSHVSGPATRYDAWFLSAHGDGFPRFRVPGTTPGAELRRRENTVGSPGTCRNVITVANYNDRTGALVASSSRGALNQTGPGPERKPTIAAPGEAIAAPRSRLLPDTASSCCDHLVHDLGGTSMAAPHLAGVVALMLQKKKDLNFEQVRAFLQGTARTDTIPLSEKPVVVDGTPTGPVWGSGKIDALEAIKAVPVPAGGGGGGAHPAPLKLAPGELGWSPHTWSSRVGEWRRRYGGHPGVQLLAALVSEHVDEVLWLVNHNRRAIIAWRRGGGHLLVRRLLQSAAADQVLIPAEVEGYDVHTLLERLTAVLSETAGQRLRADAVRFGDFAKAWPGATLAALDAAALRVQGAS